MNDKLGIMNAIRDKIEYYVLRVQRHWNVLPVKRQRLLTKLFLGGYVLLTVIMIVDVLLSTGKNNNTMLIHHINGISERPLQTEALRTDSIDTPTQN